MLTPPEEIEEVDQDIPVTEAEEAQLRANEEKLIEDQGKRVGNSETESPFV